MTIYSPNGTELITIPFNTGCIRRRVLMKDDYITVKFSLAEPKHFGIGCYVSIPNEGRFEIIKEQKPTYNSNTGGYDYELTFCAEYLKWQNKIFFYAPEGASREASWTLTAPISTHLDVFLRNLTANGFTYNGTAYSWAVDTTFNSEEAKLIQYDATNLIDALTAIADAWACEWWITDNVIHFGTCRVVSASKPPIEVSNGINADISASESASDYATRLYVFGSTRNLPANYRKGDESLTVNGVVQRRLMLPEGTPYIDAKTGMKTAEIVEKVVVIDSIYPKTNGSIAEVIPYVAKVTDENNNEVEQTFYRFKDASLTFSADYLLKDQTLGVVFTSGRLNGLQFDVVFNPNGVAEKQKDGAINPEAQLFEIVANETYGQELPSGAMLPAVGDTYILIGWDTTKIESLGLVAKAEAELLAEGRAQLVKMNIDPTTYNCAIYADTAKEACAKNDNGYIFPYGIGDPVMLNDSAYFSTGSRLSRIIGYEYPLDIPFDNPELIVGEATSYSRIGKLEEEVANIAMGGNTLSASGGGSNIYIIGTNDRTQPTNNNVYSALRTKRSFLSRLTDDIAQGKITFEQGLIALKTAIFKDGAQFGEFVGDTFAGAGAAIDAKGNAEVESIKVRSYIEAAELIVNRLSAIEGDQILTESDTIESVEDNGDGTYRLYLRRKWDGYFTAQVPNNILKGIINTLAAGNGDYYTSWMRVNSVNAGNNSIEVSLYSDEETPAGKNFPPCELMKIARWGNQADTTRQGCLYLSSTEGRIVRLTGVTKPILEPHNYGATFGTLPEFLKETDLPIIDGKDYIYARGIVVQDYIQTDHFGKPLPTYVDRGQWNEGSVYYCEELNPETGIYETSDVWYRGCKWRCALSQTKNAPAWNSTDWAMIEGNPDFSIAFADTDYIFDPDNFKLTLTIIATLYNTDITADILDADIQWTRYTEDESGNPRPSSDNAWTIKHANSGKSVDLTFADIDANGYMPKTIRFIATATLRDGMTSQAIFEY